MEVDIGCFLHQCRPSGDAAYAALKAVLEELRHPDTRCQARAFLSSLQKHIDSLDGISSLSTFHFRIHQLSLCNYQGFQENRQCLTLLELPSIFVPEDWSFTFFEGISRHPDSSFRDRDIAELGCGNGWISIALAEKWSPHKVYGLDINPRAIKAAQINLFLNALHEDGSPVFDHEGKTLLDRVEFHESDLLSYCRERGILLDRIIGCIPQILNPDPEAVQKIVSENASEEFLYSLSNYCSLQGFVEDQFGLGLIARAVEEGIGVIKPSGLMIFNIGGRPGQAVCERLFERRGFEIKKIWQTRVNQAADTDILALVEIEKNSRHRFEFFIGRVSEEPISARTAWAYAKVGGEISHGLSVYSCHLRQPNQVKTIFKFLCDGFEETRGALDLSFKDESVAEEKIPFLSHLVTALGENSHIPYELPVGSIRFRSLIAGFMQLYHSIPIGPNNLIVFSSRAVAIESFFHLFSPNLALVDATLTRLLPKKWLHSDPAKTLDGGIVVIETPKRADLVMQMLKLLKPKIVVTSLADFEMRSSTAFEQLLDACDKVGSRVLMDISEYIELSSLPGTNGVLQFLAVHPLPSHATIVCGLVKNKVYSDLEVAFIISENLDILHAMGKTLELINGRTAVSSQFYYGCLFHELLTFQLPDRYRLEQRPSIHEKQTHFIKINENVLAALEHAEMSSDIPSSDVVHADFDENLLPAPLMVKMAIFEAFSRQNLAYSEMDPTPEILEYFNIKFGVPKNYYLEIVLSDNSTALFTKLVHICRDNNGTLLFPSGSNGNYISAAKYLQANVEIIPTKQEDCFKITVAGIHDYLQSMHHPWLYICGPTINPTGLVYSNDEMCSILTACQTYGVHVIIDTSFSGLEFGSSMSFSWNLKDVLSNLENSSSVLSFIGSSSELLTGGLEFSFLLLKDPASVSAFKEAPNLSRPHGTTLYTMKRLFGIWNHKPSILSQALTLQRKVLLQRAKRMFEALKDCGWDAIEPVGGVSMVARPTAYEGRKICYEDHHRGQSMEIELHSQNIREAILHLTGLAISSSAWTCLPYYCRFGIAVDDADFTRVLQALRDFKTYVLG